MSDNLKPITRAEHLAWCKQRAHREVKPGMSGASQVIASLISDLSKHVETVSQVSIIQSLSINLLINNFLNTESEQKDFIDGVH